MQKVMILMLTSFLTSILAAEEVLYSTDFEVFEPGIIDQQNEFRANLGISPNAATVSTDSAFTGNHGVRIRGAHLDFLEDFGVYAGSYVHDVVPPDVIEGEVTVSSQVRIDSTPSGCTIGVSLLDNTGVTTLGYVGIDLSTSETFVSNSVFDEVRGETYTYGEWADFSAVFDFDTGILEGYFNGSLIGEVPIVDQVESESTLPYTGAEMVIIATEAIPNTIADFDDFSVTLTTSTGLAADLNGNGTVDFADFLILADNFGGPADPPGCCGDIDGNGEVAFADFLLLANDFGNSTALASVPEPNGFHLLMVAAMSLGHVVRRKLT